jgi:hypothetical protein
MRAIIIAAVALTALTTGTAGAATTAQPDRLEVFKEKVVRVCRKAIPVAELGEKTTLSEADLYALHTGRMQIGLDENGFSDPSERRLVEMMCYTYLRGVNDMTVQALSLTTRAEKPALSSAAR